MLLSAITRSARTALAAVVLAVTLTSCTLPTARDLAVESARTSWLDALGTLNSLAPEIQVGGFRESFIELFGKA